MKFWHNPLGSIIKIVCFAIIIGSLAGFVFPFLVKIFSIGGNFSFWEFLVSLVIASLFLNMVVLLLATQMISFNQSTFVYRVNHFFSPVQCKFVGIPGTLTLIIPLLGPLFGGTGEEPLWIFLMLGIVGCMFWSIPLVAWFLISLLMRYYNRGKEAGINT